MRVENKRPQEIMGADEMVYDFVYSNTNNNLTEYDVLRLLSHNWEYYRQFIMNRDFTRWVTKAYYEYL